MPFKAPKLARVEPEPEPEIEYEPTEVTLYESSSPGRSALEAACREQEKAWGIVTYRVRAEGGGKSPTCKALILVGSLYEVDGEGDDLDSLLGQVAESVSGG